MKKPRRIEDYLRSGIIRRAHFAASAEIEINEQINNENRTIIETVGFGYSRYPSLLDTAYAGATYISYPTGIGAAIVVWHALLASWQNECTLVGVLSGEDLAKHLLPHRRDAIKRDLVTWGIDFFYSVREAGTK